MKRFAKLEEWESGELDRNEFMVFYQRQVRRVIKKSGGDFSRTQNNRVGARFAMAVDRATREGSLLYRDSYNLTGLTGETFKKYLEGTAEMTGGIDARGKGETRP